MSENKNIPEIIYISPNHSKKDEPKKWGVWDEEEQVGIDTPYILKSKYDELLKEKEELEKENEWISVEDRLPSINEEVLGFGIDEGVKVWDFCSVKKSGFKMQSSNNRNVNITHWKPLPKAPIIKPTEK